MPHFEDCSVRMIFVCGCGHSGTSLVTAMLGAHEKIYSITEETYLFIKDGLSDEDIKTAFRRKYVPFAKAKNASVLCEKTPRHIRSLDRLRMVFPGARIIIPVRDARDVSLSMKLRTGSLNVGCESWQYDNTLVRREVEASSGDTFVFRYEDFMDDVEGVLVQMCKCIGLAFDHRMLDYHKDSRPWFGVNAAEPLPQFPPSPEDHVRFRNW